MDRPASWRTQRIDLAVEPRLTIGGAAVDPVSREIHFADGPERLQPKILKVLIALARRRGEVVTRAELVDQCWDGRIVGEDVINHAVSVLRGLAAKSGTFEIETIPKAGYRLIETAVSVVSPRRLAPWLGWLTAAAVPAGLLLALPGTQVDEKAGEPPPSVVLRAFATPPGDAAAAEVARATRIALSHMLNESGLPVRLAERGDAASDFIVSGDILRGARALEANVRLEETRRHTIIFTHRFEAVGSDPDSLPDQVGASLSANLSWGAAMMVLDRRHSTDPAIMSEMLKQLSITVEGGDMLRAFAIARDIARRAPDSPMAQIGLAFNSGFVLEDLPRDQRAAAVALGRAAAARSRLLAPEFGDSYIPWCLMHGPMRKAACEAELRRGLAADPDAPFVTAFLSALMSEVGRFDYGLELARMSIASGPYMPAKNMRLISALTVTGYAAEADGVYAQARRWWPTNPRVTWGGVYGDLLRGDVAAIAGLPAADPALRAAAAELAAAEEAAQPAARTRACSGQVRGDLTMLCFVAEAGGREMDSAFALAGRMYPRKDGRNVAEEEQWWLDDPFGFPLALLSAPATAALRRDPRFVDVAARTGLLRYWRTNGLPDFCRSPAEPVCNRLRGR